MKIILPILLFLSCASPTWIIEKKDECTAFIYIETIHSSELNKKTFKHLEKEYQELLDSMNDCDSMTIRWMALRKKEKK